MSQPTTTHTTTSPEAPGGLPGTPDRDLWPAAKEPGTGNVLWQMFSSVLIILGLGAAAIIVIKKVLPRLGFAAGVGGLRALRGGKMRVLESARLGPQRHVYLMDVEGRRFLLGDAKEGITLIAEVKPQPESSPVQEEGGK